MTLAIKRVGPNTIEGLAIPFGRKDLVGESFDDSTDFCIDWFGPSGRPLLYDHGLNKAVKTDRAGRQSEYEVRGTKGSEDWGIWAQSELEANRAYRKVVDELIEQEALGYSSGAMQHLATKHARSGLITRWPWVELSMTPMPAAPETLNIHYVKSAREAIEAIETDVVIPEPLKAALAALDEWAEQREAPAASYADELERVLLGSKALVERTHDISDLRVKSGRVLSAANRERLVTLRDRIATASEHADEVLRDLDEMLSTTDPAAADEASKALTAAVFETLAREARELGVDITL